MGDRRRRQPWPCPPCTSSGGRLIALWAQPKKETFEMLNRRTALKLTAALVASQPVPDSTAAMPAADTAQAVSRELPHLSLTEDLQDVIDALAGHIQTFRAGDWAEY